MVRGECSVKDRAHHNVFLLDLEVVKLKCVCVNQHLVSTLHQWLTLCNPFFPVPHSICLSVYSRLGNANLLKRGYFFPYIAPYLMLYY